ncbi:universal stress protein [Chelatococcus asaccharovorans]|uniref:Nucleotide-binding universal stress UspA family protein n=1 Tax=Chelatococcus asaccharovorans TaxID=28210 RepID=A0A2V3TTP3_9HYPH|nr:universal stress protein [Chelatococcus asaccharovorans]MBS7706087.1 universal stress protein [Chelatococcus asaccharovorans]PXW52456.1 nucleotide-binding universal stress UspA family protein [Chelatococcus asaccharovorans]CAH1659932.1 Nucleotide-binding universal stress UspA family protein [Chelatococcus asaccharovorans]CAH1684001.1 Nucleotide-binding universal stress UspA family protein [Chelatococcus asaccharovorans]
MFNHILIPTDGSPLSLIAVDEGLAFARDAGAKVTLLTVVEPFHIFSADPDQIAGTRQDYERQANERAAAYLSKAELKARALGVPCEAVRRESEDPYQAIIDTATAKGCDLIAMASHGRRGVTAVVLGSQTLKVLTHSKIPVLVYR